MSGFGDEQLNNLAMSLEQIEEYMGRISASLEKLATLFEKEFAGEWKQIS